MRLITLLLSLCLTIHVSSQDCPTNARNKPSSFAIVGNEVAHGPARSMNNRVVNKTDMRLHLDKVAAWVREVTKGLTGVKIEGHDDYYADFDKPDNIRDSVENHFRIPDSYAFNTMFFAYYCYENRDKIEVEGESGSNLTVYFNNIFATNLIPDNPFIDTIDGKPAFAIYEKERTEGRIDYYNYIHPMSYGDTVYPSKKEIMVIRNNDQPLFIRFTRKAYLQQLKINVARARIQEKQFLKNLFESEKASLEREIKIKKEYDKTYTTEKENKARADFAQRVNPEKLEADLVKVDRRIDGSLSIIDKYLAGSEEWLSRPLNDRFVYIGNEPASVEQFIKGLDKRHDLYDMKETGEEVVYLNPEYFKNQDKLKFIIVDLRKNGYRHMQKLSETLHQPGVFASLQALFGAKAPQVPVRAYTLKYLPKLDRLPTLAIPSGFTSSFPEMPVTSSVPAAKIDYNLPKLSPMLKLLPTGLNAESYKDYIENLNARISKAMKQVDKTNAETFLKKENVSGSKAIGNIALSAWIHKAPRAGIYLYGKAVATELSDALTANNFASLLITGGMPDKAIPILEYWNGKRTNAPVILTNLGNAYYQLGDIDKSIRYLEQAVQKDTLNPTAHKILCMIYAKKGDVKKAEEHGTKTISTTYDEVVISILHQLKPKKRFGDILSLSNQKEFPLLKRTSLPMMPSELENMDAFMIELEAEKQSISMTIQDMSAKVSRDQTAQSGPAKIRMAEFPILMKAQTIVMDAMEDYKRESLKADEVYEYEYKAKTKAHTGAVKAVVAKYDALMKGLKGGEGGDEPKLIALENEKCKEINSLKQQYLQGLAPLVNEYAKRREYISRRFARDYANWGPIWSKGNLQFLSVAYDYLKDIYNIMGNYHTVTMQHCIDPDPLSEKPGKLKVYEDQYCSNFKGKWKAGAVKITFTCTSFGIEGGEGILGEAEMNFHEDGTFQDFTAAIGVGANLGIEEKEIGKLEVGASAKVFVKIGPGGPGENWEVKDVGVKGEIAGEAGLFEGSAEAKLVEVSIAMNAGVGVGGMVPALFDLN